MKVIKIDRDENGNWGVAYRGVLGYLLYWVILGIIVGPWAVLFGYWLARTL